jgi:hypothetical protein
LKRAFGLIALSRTERLLKEARSHFIFELMKPILKLNQPFAILKINVARLPTH